MVASSHYYSCRSCCWCSRFHGVYPSVRSSWMLLLSMLTYLCDFLWSMFALLFLVLFMALTVSACAPSHHCSCCCWCSCWLHSIIALAAHAVDARGDLQTKHACMNTRYPDAHKQRLRKQKGLRVCRLAPTFWSLTSFPMRRGQYWKLLSVKEISIG